MPISKLPLDTIRLLGSSVAISTSSALVKELLDNALDAGATIVEVLISANTVDKIQVRDNGTGISLDDIDNLGKRAHTSKLRRIEDLDGSFKTLGFRGEALAGTNGVAKEGVWITTRTEDESVAMRLKLKKGVGGAEERKPVSAPVGTTVTVEGLFGGIPVRKKQAEKERRKSLARIRDLMLAYVLARPHLKLTLKVAGEPSLGWRHSPAAEGTARDVVLQLLGKNLAAQCTDIGMFWVPDSNGPSHAPTITMQALLPTSDCDIEYVKGKGAFISVDQRPITSVRGAGKKIATFHKTHLSNVRRGSITSPFMQINIGFSSGAGYDPNIAPLKDEILFLDEGRIVDCFEELCRAVYKKENGIPTLEEVSVDAPETFLTVDGQPRSVLAQAALRGSKTLDNHVEPKDVPDPSPNAVFIPDDQASRAAPNDPESNAGIGFLNNIKADADMLQFLEEDLHEHCGSSSAGNQATHENSAAEEASKQMRTRIRVNLGRKVSDATDEDSTADCVPVRVPSRPIQGSACKLNMARTTATPKSTATTYQMEDITRFLQPQRSGKTFQIATNDTATEGGASEAVEQTMRNLGRTPLDPVKETTLNESPRGGDSLFGSPEPDILRPPHAPERDLAGSLGRAGPRLQEHNLHLLQQALEDSQPPANAHEGPTMSPLARASTALRTPPSSNPRQPSATPDMSKRRPTRIRAGADDDYVPQGSRDGDQGAQEGSNAHTRVSLRPRRGLNSTPTTAAATMESHAQLTRWRPNFSKKPHNFSTQNPYDLFSASRSSPG